MLIPSKRSSKGGGAPSLSRRVNANSQRIRFDNIRLRKLIKKGEC